VRSLVADAVASDEVVSGVREELAREGALEAGEGYPRVEIEVLRADESSAGIAASPVSPATNQGPVSPATNQGPVNPATNLGPASDTVPLARATEVGLVARAWLVNAPGAATENDTGDLRAVDLVALDAPTGALNARADAFHHVDALRAAARRLGHRLGARVLGQPTATDERIGR
jgi:hypothetical protein